MRRESLSAGALIAVGLTLAAVQVVTLDGSLTSTAVVVRSIPMIAIGGAVVYGGAWLLYAGGADDHADRVLAWTLGGGVTVGAVVVLAAVGRSVPGAVLALTTDAFTGGALVGMLVGVYDARGKRRRDRIEGFARKVAALNQYGKALNRSQTVDEISALCVEAVEFLVAGDGAAFVLVEERPAGGTTDSRATTDQTTDGRATTDGRQNSGDGDEEVTVVDSTLRGEQELRVLEALAHEVDDDDGIEAVRYAETTVDLGDRSPDAALVIPVPTAEGRTLIVSLSTAAAIEYDEEDVDLLETLAAHVSTAMENVEQRTPAAGVPTANATGAETNGTTARVEEAEGEPTGGVTDPDIDTDVTSNATGSADAADDVDRRTGAADDADRRTDASDERNTESESDHDDSTPAED